MTSRRSSRESLRGSSYRTWREPGHTGQAAGPWCKGYGRGVEGGATVSGCSVEFVVCLICLRWKRNVISATTLPDLS